MGRQGLKNSKCFGLERQFCFLALSAFVQGQTDLTELFKFLELRGLLSTENLHYVQLK